MKRIVTTGTWAALFTFCLTCAASVAPAQPNTPTVLRVSKATPKLEVRQSQIGFRDTLLFYTFKKQNAVLKLRFDNKNKAFPVTGTVYLFAKTVTEEGIKKWLNNQHSDGLYPDVPNPESTAKLPAKVCKVTTRTFVGKTKQPFGEYDNYVVTFSVADFADPKNFALKGFMGETKVHVKTK